MHTRDIENLHHRFYRIIRQCGSKARKRTIREEFDQDVERYESSGRFYHTLAHVKNMLDLIDEHQKAFMRPDLVRFAAVKHDTIYNVHFTKDNEALSAAKAARTAAKVGLSSRDTEIIVGLIMATEHLGNRERHKIMSEDEKLLADLDLDGLSRSWDTVLHHSRNVRREFSHVSDKEFGNAHIGFWNLMEFRGFIYLSPQYKQHEEKARDNIATLKHNMHRSVASARPHHKFTT